MDSVMFRLKFSKVAEVLPDPDIQEDNGMRKPVTEVFLDDDYSIASVVNAMCADGWTCETICRTLQYKSSIKEDE